VTSESEAETVPWVKEHGAKYAYAYDPGQKFMRALGLAGMPTAWLVDSTGTVVWQGHPGNLQESTVEAVLSGALTTPMWDWPKEAAPIKKPLAKRQIAAALKEAEKLAQTNEAIAAIQKAIQGVVDGRVAGMNKMKEDGNALDAFNAAVSIAKDCAGLPAAEDAAAVQKAIAADATLKAVMDAQTAVRKLREKDPDDEKSIKAAQKKLKKIAEDHANTAAAREADAFSAELQELLDAKTKRG
jgi:hypothetical protein